MTSDSLRRFVAWVACAFAATGSTGAPLSSPGVALAPIPESDAHWLRIHAAQRDQLRLAATDVYFLGDSITADWTGTGRAEWERVFRGWRKVNGGISGDRVEHVLWRVQHLDWTAHEPRVVVLLVGTNNLSQPEPTPPAQLAATLAAITTHLVDATKHTEVVILSILPNGLPPGTRLRRDIRQTNALLAPLDGLDRVTWVDVHDHFLQNGDNWSPSLTLDGTHLSAPGYAVLAGLLRTVIEPLIDRGGR